MNNQKKRWLSKEVLGFGLTSFFNDFAHEMTTALLPAFVNALIAPTYAPQALGLITGFSNSVSSMIKLWAGWLGDRLTKYKPILILGYAVQPIFIALIGLTNSILQIAILRTIGWSGKGIREPIRDKWMSSMLEPKDLGKGFGFTRSLDTLGAICGPLFTYFTLSYLSLRTIFLLSFIPGMLSILTLIFFVKERNNKPHPEQIIFFKQIKSLPSSFLYFALIFFIFNMAFFDKSFLIFKAQKVLSGNQVAQITVSEYAILLYVLFSIIRALSEYSSGFISDYVSRKKMLAFSGFGFFGITCLMLIFHDSNVLLWFLIFIVLGISTATVTVVSKAYAADLLPLSVRGTGYGLLQAAEGIGQLAAGLIVGSLWTYFSGSVALAYAAGLGFIAMILLLIKR